LASPEFANDLEHLKHQTMDGKENQDPNFQISNIIDYDEDDDYGDDDGEEDDFSEGMHLT
jgi:hypothetical protein